MTCGSSLKTNYPSVVYGNEKSYVSHVGLEETDATDSGQMSQTFFNCSQRTKYLLRAKTLACCKLPAS